MPKKTKLRIGTDWKVSKFYLSDSHLVLALINFLAPMLLTVAETWANSVIQTLFDILHLSDYNKKLNL